MFLWFACTSPESQPPEDSDDPPRIESTADTATSSGSTGSTADTAVPEVVDPRCLEPLPVDGFEVRTINRIHTEEDFDFDGTGYLVAQGNTNLLGWPRNGDHDTLSPNIGVDAAGIRALPSGDFVVAQPDTGVVKLVSGVNGGAVNAATGMNYPNGLEVGRDGTVYVSEFLPNGGLKQLDPYAGNVDVLMAGVAVNGVALSPDELVLYVSTWDFTAGGGDAGRIASLERPSTDEPWGPPTMLMETRALVQGLTTDICGNLYMVDTQTAEVFRYNDEDGSVDRLISLSAEAGAGFVSSARFGAGFGGWKRNELHLTDRARIYVIDVGIDGRHVLAP